MSSEWDPSGQRLVGLGLTMVPTQRRFRVGGHDLWAWCAGDTLVVPVWIGVPAQVEPAGAVASFVTPPTDISQVREAVCFNSHYFRSAEAAASWQAQHPDGLVLPVAEAFEVLRLAWGDLLPSAG